jgi:hypothetical protein
MNWQPVISRLIVKMDRMNLDINFFYAPVFLSSLSMASSIVGSMLSAL